MAKVDGSISSLIQGVSQQPARERLAGQGELQINCTSDVVNGLARRGPTHDLGELLNSSDDWFFQHHDAGSDGTYIIANKDNTIKVFNLDTTENTVSYDTGTADYIPDGKIKTVGIEDDIFVLNTAVQVDMLTDTRSYIDNGALVFALGGQYGRDYKITVTWNNGSSTAQGTYSTPDGATSSDIEDIRTDAIISGLMTSVSSAWGGNFSYQIKSDVAYIYPNNPTSIPSFTVTVDDGDGGANVFAVNNVVDDVGDLPRYAPHGYLVKVQEGSTTDRDDWYLEFISNVDGRATGAGFGDDGLWVETVAPDIPYKLDHSTMPHVLTKTGATTFTLSQGDWDDREVGDEETNPNPSFVGQTIYDINAFQGRLALTSTVNLILSRSAKPYGFWNQSATTLADDDPIDVASTLGTYDMKTLVPYNRDLVVFSDKAQFIMFGRNVITPKNSSLVRTSEFEALLDADPVPAGRNVLFAFKYGSFSGMQEFYADGAEDINDARPITSNVAKYIEGNATLLTSTTNFNKLVVHTDADAKTLYLYEYIWVNQQKAQSSWSKWTFDRDILHSFFVDNLLYLVQKDGTSYRLAVFDLDDTPNADTGYRVMLDNQLEFTSVNTTLTIPYTVDDIDNFVVVQGEGCPHVGMRAEIESYAAGTVTLVNDMQGGKVYFGRKYLSRYQPTTPFVRDQDGVKVGSGKLTIKNYQVHFNNTGYFEAVITDDHGYEAVVTYNGRVLGAPTNLVGKPAIVDGNYTVPCKKNADSSQLEIRSDSHLPFYLLEMEWLGQWKKKGRRITGG